MNNVFKALGLLLIQIYRVFFRPTYGNACRHIPSCSEYSRQAVSQYGFLKGCLLTLWRLLRCQPFSKGGFDPLPMKGPKNV